MLTPSNTRLRRTYVRRLHEINIHERRAGRRFTPKNMGLGLGLDLDPNPKPNPNPKTKKKQIPNPKTQKFLGFENNLFTFLC